MAIDYATLKLEIAKPAYNGLDDARIAVRVMRTSITDVPRRVPSAEFAQLWARRGVLAEAWFAAQDTAGTVAKRKRARRMLDMVEQDVFGSLDTSLEADRTELAALTAQWVTDGIMSAADQTATTGMPYRGRPGREVWGELSETDIAAAKVFTP